MIKPNTGTDPGDLVLALVYSKGVLADLGFASHASNPVGFADKRPEGVPSDFNDDNFKRFLQDLSPF